MDLGFLELGFDSLTVTRFLSQLNAVTGLRLPASALSEYPSPATLAAHLSTALAAPASPGAGDTAGALGDGGAQDQNEPPSHSLTGLFVRAAREHRATEMTPLIQGLAAFRPTFDGPADADADDAGPGNPGRLPAPVPVTHGPATPGLVCFPSFLGRSSAQEYARFARAFRGERELTVLPAPGFAAGQLLPATLDALVSVHAENVRRVTAGAPYVLVGHSSGGMVAHAVATRLDGTDAAPAGVVIIDTPSPRAPAAAGPAATAAARHAAALSGDHWNVFLSAALAKLELSAEAADDAWITAMVYYFSLGWSALGETSLPTLLVRATEPMGGNPDAGEWQATWALSSQVTVADVPGNHFTMMGDHAGTTAAAVNTWLATL
jgi:thioesterase domain-containing protein